ncbi:Maf family protein [Patescibacteria group bacterium]
MKKRLILASTSPRRKELLAQIGLEFDILPGDYEEDMTKDLVSEELAKELAYGKAQDVANKVESGVVIGCDTFIEHEGKKMGKPKSEEDAKNILRSISGQVIKVYSGVAIIDKDSDREVVDFEVTDIKIKELSEKEIDDYIATGEPLDKAGAFAIQGRGAVFVEKVDGCYSSVVGMPLFRLYAGLQKLGIDI